MSLRGAQPDNRGEAVSVISPADRVGVTRQTIIALESGKYAPSLMLALRIARVFDVNVEAVFVYCNGIPKDGGRNRR